MKYSVYVDKVLALLDKTDVPKMLNMAAYLANVSDEAHAKNLHVTIRDAYVRNLTVEETATIIKEAVTIAFAEAFGTSKEERIQ